MTTDQLIRQVSDVVPVLQGHRRGHPDLHPRAAARRSRRTSTTASPRTARRSRRMLANMEAITGDVRGITRGATGTSSGSSTTSSTSPAAIRTLVGQERPGGRRDHRQAEGRPGQAGLGASTSSTRPGQRQTTITGDVQEGKGTVGRLLKDETLINDVEERGQGRRRVRPVAHRPADHRRAAQRVQLPRQHASRPTSASRSGPGRTSTT